MLVPRPVPKLEDPLSAVRDCVFNIFVAALHIGRNSFIHNLRALHAVVTGTHLLGGSINTFSGNPKHVVPRKSASCKSVGSTRTDRLDESYVRSSSTNTSVSVSRHTTVIFNTLCCVYFLSFVYRHSHGTDNSRHARRIQISSVSVEQQTTTGTGSTQNLKTLAIWETAMCRG